MRLKLLFLWTLCLLTLLLTGFLFWRAISPRQHPYERIKTQKVTSPIVNHALFMESELERTEEALHALTAKPLLRVAGFWAKERTAFLVSNRAFQESLLKMKAACLITLLHQGRQITYLLKGVAMLFGLVITTNMVLLSLLILK